MLQIRKHVGDHATLGPQRGAEFVAKGAQALFALGQQGIYQILESFYESHIGRGSLKLVEFTAAEISAPRGNRLVHLMDQRRLARAGIATDEDEQTFAVRAAVEGVDERGCLRFPSIHARRQAKEHGIVIFAEREGGRIDAHLLEVHQTAFQIMSQALSRLVSVVRILRHQLVDDGRERAGRLWIELPQRNRNLREMRVHHAQRVGGLKRQCIGQNFVERDAHGIEVGAEVHGAIHAAGLLRRAIGERAFDQFGIAHIALLEVEHRRNGEVNEPDAALLKVDEDVGRSDVLVDDVVVMNLPKRARRRDCDMKDVDDVRGFLTKGGLQIFAVQPFHFDCVAVVFPRLAQRSTSSGKLQAVDDFEFVVKLRDVGRRRKLVIEHLDRGNFARHAILASEDFGFLALVYEAITH